MKYFTLLFLFFSFINVLISQDLVVTKKGDSLNCKITNESATTIKYVARNADGIRETLIRKKNIEYFQYNYFEKPDLPNSLIIGGYINDLNRYKFRIKLAGGLGYRIFQTPVGLSNSVRDYIDDLKSGYNIGVDASYFFKEKYGIGLKYSSFNSSNSANRMSGYIGKASFTDESMSDNISIDYIGPAFYIKNKLSESVFFYSSLSLVYLSYSNDGFFKVPMIISSETIGFVGSLGLDFLINKSLALGLDVTLLSGKMTEITMKSGSQTQVLNLDPDQAESLTRVDISVGVMYYF